MLMQEEMVGLSARLTLVLIGRDQVQGIGTHTLVLYGPQPIPPCINKKNLLGNF